MLLGAVSIIAGLVSVGVAYYAPASGYLGSDVFVLQTNLSNGKTKVRNNLTYRVTVE